VLNEKTKAFVSTFVHYIIIVEWEFTYHDLLFALTLKKDFSTSSIYFVHENFNFKQSIIHPQDAQSPINNITVCKYNHRVYASVAGDSFSSNLLHNMLPLNWVLL